MPEFMRGEQIAHASLDMNFSCSGEIKIPAAYKFPFYQMISEIKKAKTIFR